MDEKNNKVEKEKDAKAKEKYEKENKEDELKGGIKNMWMNFASTTTAHGFSHLTVSTNTTIRLLWISVIIACQVLLYLQIHPLVVNYLEKPTKTKLYLREEKSQVFPVITICNTNPIKASKVDELRSYSEFEDSEENYFGTTNNSSTDSGNDDRRKKKRRRRKSLTTKDAASPKQYQNNNNIINNKYGGMRGNKGALKNEGILSWSFFKPYNIYYLLTTQLKIVFFFKIVNTVSPQIIILISVKIFT